MMYTIYRVNADELTLEFLETLKTLFKHKTIEIAVCEADQAGQDETAYLLGNPANRARLLEAIENVAKKRNLVTLDVAELNFSAKLSAGNIPVGVINPDRKGSPRSPRRADKARVFAPSSATPAHRCNPQNGG